MAQWLALFAVLSQALLPVAHAQLMARSGDHPLALFACGTGSADFVDALAALLPPELLASQNDDGAGAANGAYECPACAALSASGHGIAPSIAIHCTGQAKGSGALAQQAKMLARGHDSLRPPVRAPPV
ncbi:DUF2946 family protein [Algiphilus sp.]|uniref:DUF2946 family protein n=1 Tax=Algiphilus sp. TaxID=1872431 RepID=UPI003B52782A